MFLGEVSESVASLGAKRYAFEKAVKGLLLIYDWLLLVH